MRLHNLAVAASPGLVLALTAFSPLAQTPQHNHLLGNTPAKSESRSDAPEALRVGDILNADRITMIERPGLYGLGLAPEGSAFALSSGKLLRIDPETGQILSILRDVGR